MNRAILERSAWLEVLVRNLYWRSSWVNKWLSKKARSRTHSLSQVDTPFDPNFMPLLLEQLQALGVELNDILIVHSAQAAFKASALSASQICEALFSLVKVGGTLALPALPLFKEGATGIERLNNEICQRRLTYDVQRTPTWTGALPRALMRFSGAVRSRHPLNTMVAYGEHAAAMMARNLDGDHPTACGKGSAWKYCADHNAKIVCIGVDTAHSLTMIHVAEDCWEEEWPISDWYRERAFHVKDGEWSADITVRERHPKWAMYYAERTLQKDLLAAGILQVCYVQGVKIEFCESIALLEFLNSRKGQAYPYWIPRWRR